MAILSPVVGYNTNVRHKGKLYHLQTEDSGVQNPHITTHLFADGGRVVASKKSSYAEHVDQEDYRDVVKKLMQAQHKAMFIELRDGVHDEDEDAPEPSPSDTIAEGSPVAIHRSDTDPAFAQVDEHRSSSPAAFRPPQTEPAPSPFATDEDDGRKTELSIEPLFTESSHDAIPLIRGRKDTEESITPDPPEDETESVLDRADAGVYEAGPDVEQRKTLVHEKAASGDGGARRPKSQPPPTPKSVRPSARRHSSQGKAVAVHDTIAPPAAEGRRGPPKSMMPRRPSAAGRYQVTRPPSDAPRSDSMDAIPKAAAVPREAATESVFASDLISEKSLDEVILAYLAEDLDDA